MIKLLHFSDAHIDIAAQGKKDPTSGLPYRVMDFLKALDTIIDYAIQTPVDLVLFTGDAYRDRTPSPTYQREWGKRMIRLSQAKIPTVLLVGNHDISPAHGRAHALHEYDTLSIPYIRVVDKPSFLGPADLNGLPVQIIALPWISVNNLLIMSEEQNGSRNDLNNGLEKIIDGFIDINLEQARRDLPLIFAAHAEVQGAVLGSEQNLMSGRDYSINGSLLRNPRFDYVALGHIHKAQDLNEGNHPPVVYAGSIEKVDFGEIEDHKCFVVAEVDCGNTRLERMELMGRHLSQGSIDLRMLEKDFDEGTLPDTKTIMNFIQARLPKPEEIEDSVCKLLLSYPRDWEALIDFPQLDAYYKDALETHIIRKPQISTRIRLGSDESITHLSPAELLATYLQSRNVEEPEIAALQELAVKIIYNHEEAQQPEVGSK